MHSRHAGISCDSMATQIATGISSSGCSLQRGGGKPSEPMPNLLSFFCKHSFIQLYGEFGDSGPIVFLAELLGNLFPRMSSFFRFCGHPKPLFF